MDRKIRGGSVSECIRNTAASVFCYVPHKRKDSVRPFRQKKYLLQENYLNSLDRSYHLPPQYIWLETSAFSGSCTSFMIHL